MKFFIILALALAAASAATLKSRAIEGPVFGDIEGRIFNGQTATAGQFPYQVGLSLYLNFLNVLWCGGSLIGNEWVLTAAHCTVGITKVIVYLGSTVRNTGAVTHTVYSNNFIIHDDFNLLTLANDIALIRIPATSYTPLIQAIALPALDTSYPSYDNEQVVISGWGRTSASSIAGATNLQYGYSNIITNDMCADILLKPVPNSQICIHGGASTCQGDSGGPLVLTDSDVLVGIDSYRWAPCVDIIPDIFTNVAYHRGWIECNIKLLPNCGTETGAEY